MSPMDKVRPAPGYTLDIKGNPHERLIQRLACNATTTVSATFAGRP
ncbi:hypothetical protein [Pseudomonas cannabina]|nr:hypothetical protein [Pseudomonas cannabina]